MGHIEGITFIDSRGDGRYLISNGKDQSIKLWDIRKMSSNSTWYEWYIQNFEKMILVYDKIVMMKIFVGRFSAIEGTGITNGIIDGWTTLSKQETWSIRTINLSPRIKVILYCVLLSVATSHQNIGEWGARSKLFDWKISKTLMFDLTIVCSTGRKYIYTGSHDSCVYIYDLVRRPSYISVNS